MSGRLFGTDGVRARFGEEPLVEATVRRLGSALGALLRERGGSPRLLVGGDTRRSTPALVAWSCDGLARAGVHAVDLGVVPTAAVARLVAARAADAGLVVSASHNPATDNGLKLIGPDGFKWPDAGEDELEARLRREPAPSTPLDGGCELDPAAVHDYLAALAGQLAGARPLAGLAIALDCAHGAASGLAGELFTRLGARVEVLFDRPDGDNINRGCGSTHPQALAEHVRHGGFDLGFAFDGDADRTIAVDGRGEVRDGDALMYLWARHLAAAGELEPRALVATSMSNLGLERALAAHGIETVRCDVGDRWVVATLRERGLRLGGEQSGHLVDLRRSTTGDGLLTAVAIAGIVAETGRPLHDLLHGFRRYPQLIENVRVRAKPKLETLPEVQRVAKAVTDRLGADGRLVLRYSGTEPLARIMIEGPDEATIRTLAAELAAAIRDAIGADAVPAASQKQGSS